MSPYTTLTPEQISALADQAWAEGIVRIWRECQSPATRWRTPNDRTITIRQWAPDFRRLRLPMPV